MKNEISRTGSAYKKCKGGRNKLQFDKKVNKISVTSAEIVNVQGLKPQSDLTDLHSESIPTMNAPESPGSFEISDDKENIPNFDNSGVRIDNASKTNKSKIIKKLENKVEKALGFVETFGVVPKELLCETFTGESCTINIDGSKSAKNTGYDNLSTADQSKVQKILHVCDNSIISDSAYHELAMQCESLPRKSTFVACRNEINSKFEVMRTPGLLPGSYLSFKKEINDYVQMREDVPKKLQVKVSGDGAKVSRISNFIVTSWSVIDDEHSTSHFNQSVLAIVKYEENYATLEKTLGPLFDEINEIAKEGHIYVGSERVGIELFVGGDMKFTQLLLGLNSSIATYACPWCKVAKEDRGNVSHPWDFYHSDQLFRSVKENKDLAGMSSKSYGVKALPLLDVDQITIFPTNYIF